MEDFLLNDLTALLQPKPQQHAAFVALAKQYLDPLASAITEAQKSRKRKRGGAESLRMRKIHTDGFDVDQIWQQARRVLSAANSELAQFVPLSVEEGVAKASSDEKDSEAAWSDEDAMNVDDMELPAFDDAASSEGSLDIGSDTPESEVSGGEVRTETLVKDKFGLNDGFFSIDSFNKQSQFLEQADARGESDGAASDEEEVDWTMDPSQVDSRAAPKQKQNDEEMAPEEEDEEDGPTFGNADLDASESEDVSDLDMQDAGGDFSNTNDILYKDFFAPPARLASKKPHLKPPRKPKELVEAIDAADGNAVERNMAAAQRDLFDDDVSENEDFLAHTPGDPQPPTNLSSHERAQLALRAEIRRLEAAAVAEKPWYMTGETVAATRPQNSTLEEDLDFERAGKPVPVPGAADEAGENIEALIIRRILARQFDEVIRRLALDEPVRRGRAPDADIDLERRPGGLADEYAAALGDSGRSDALAKTHAAVVAHWAAVSAQLDALSNWHYKARPAAPALTVRAAVPTVVMEDARPAGEAGESGLAPQEVYRVGEEGKKERAREGERLTAGGTAVAREEEGRDAKRRRRRRDKERTRKANGNAGAVDGDAGKTAGTEKPKSQRADRKQLESQLSKGGARIIDRAGALRHIEGRAVDDFESGRAGVGTLRL